jgi:hypothetical protein
MTISIRSESETDQVKNVTTEHFDQNYNQPIPRRNKPTIFVPITGTPSGGLTPIQIKRNNKP